MASPVVNTAWQGLNGASSSGKGNIHSSHDNSQLSRSMDPRSPELKMEDSASPEKDISWEKQEAQDDAYIAMLMDDDPENQQEEGKGMRSAMKGFLERDIDQGGKDDDAIDFEDIGDDELASEDEEGLPRNTATNATTAGIATNDDNDDDDLGFTFGDDDDDLFGDNNDDDQNQLEDFLNDGDANDTQQHTQSQAQTQSPTQTETQTQTHTHDGLNSHSENVKIPPKDLPASISPPANTNAPPVSTSATRLRPPMILTLSESLEADELAEDEWNAMSMDERQRLNFPSVANSVNKWVTDQSQHQDPAVPVPPRDIDELLKQTFPTYTPYGRMNLAELFKDPPAEFGYKGPPKSPPPLMPTKLELELEADSAKLFRIPDNAATAAHKKAAGGDGNAWQGGNAVPLNFDDLSDTDDEDQTVFGLTINEIATICDDWHFNAKPKLKSKTKIKAKAKDAQKSASDNDENVEMDDWDREFANHKNPQPKKKRKYEPGLPRIVTYPTYGLNNPFKACQLQASQVLLDLNDPYLLVEDILPQPQAKRRRTEEKTTRMANGRMSKNVMSRFNMSNDDAYNMLKAHKQSKIRATLANLAVEHSMPALKLTFPFYRTRIEGEFWQHHRPSFDLEKIIRCAIPFKKPARVRRKENKGKSAQEIFKTTKDLSLNDNSTTVLFEYSEQTPPMMSNVGMGSRVINYYRRRNSHDEDKPPKIDIGEPHVLLPEDRSPFTIFGTVEPGETVPTLHNEMYRAPIFKHKPKDTDFLLGYSTSVADGPRFYLKNIDHLYVVGQTFPSMEVPGPNARRVTTTNKNRLRMISYRMMRKSGKQDIDMHALTGHVFEKYDSQNRQKMKEFLVYDKDSRTYVLPEGQSLMDEAKIRDMIKPEDLCLIEAMHIGQMRLQAVGYDPKTEQGDDDDDQKPLVAKMSPWKLTKNFLEASAGKAMVTLHGPGDPTGHGLGFSFIKTSMKGGYINAVQGPMATSADAIERERKANGGHSYNVKKQQEMYNHAIQKIWERQRKSLTDETTHADSDMLDTANEDDRFNMANQQAEYAAISAMDDGRSQLSRLSGVSGMKKRKLKITRKKRDENGNEVLETVLLTDPAVIRSYMKHRRDLEDATDVYNIQPTGEAVDRQNLHLVNQELARLTKNYERRQVREKQGKKSKKQQQAQQAASLAATHNVDATNGVGSAGSPEPSNEKHAGGGGTTRKCANCGQIGHIKTNKSKCPYLNGTVTQKPENADYGGFGSFSAPAPESSQGG